MNDYKSVQDIIVKAALYDGVSTTISADTDSLGWQILKITFSKDGCHSAAHMDTHHITEEGALYICKDALHDLLWGRYAEIKVKEE